MNLGYAYINLTLAQKGISTNKGMVRRTCEAKGVQYASQLALQNVQALLKILQRNLEKGIRVFRITSELFPWASEYQLESMPDFAAIRPNGKLIQIGFMKKSIPTARRSILF